MTLKGYSSPFGLVSKELNWLFDPLGVMLLYNHRYCCCLINTTNLQKVGFNEKSEENETLDKIKACLSRTHLSCDGFFASLLFS